MAIPPSSEPPARSGLTEPDVRPGATDGAAPAALPATADLVVIGAGIVGLATARAWQAARPDGRVVVLDKEPTVAAHQSGHNSGVIHAGVYYAPGSREGRAVCGGA